jgi:hypothetical protein
MELTSFWRKTAGTMQADNLIAEQESWTLKNLSYRKCLTIRIVAAINASLIIFFCLVHFSATLSIDILLIILKENHYNIPLKPRSYGPEFGILGLPYVFLLVVFVTNFIPPIFSFYMFGRELDFQKRSPMRTRYFFYTLILAYVHYYYFILERKFRFNKINFIQNS